MNFSDKPTDRISCNSTLKNPSNWTPDVSFQSEEDKSSAKMKYKYDNGIELLLAHMNLEDIINAAETLYQLEQEEEEEEEEGGLSFEEGLSQEEMDENEEAGDLGSQQKDYADGDGGVRYGTVTDLLSFVNLLSSMDTAALPHLQKEMGVLLNKVRSCFFVLLSVSVHDHLSDSDDL